MKITVSGKIGAGKTTVSKALAKKLKLKYLSTGTVMRELAKEKGLTISEFLKFAEKETRYHKELDKKTIEIGKTKDNFVFDSRLAFKFIPDSVKIFLNVNINTAAKRIFNQKRRSEKENISLEKTKKAIKQREKLEIKSYKRLYNVNHHDKKNYDLVIDTSESTPEKTVNNLIKFLRQKQK
ncbi:cytidylate kinase family protein [Candidatus Woesearchaeota archaeon]|nr:cytidylate kinase family protein [Candidatus Woesearchaeota archaeon]